MYFFGRNALLLTITSVLACPIASAVPAFWNKWQHAAIENPDNLRFYGDTEQKNLIWVKPPPMGFVARGEGSVSHHPNHSRCKDLSQSLKDVLRNTKQFERSLAQLERFDSSLKGDKERFANAIHNRQDYLSTTKMRIPATEIMFVTDKMNAAMLAENEIDHRLDGCKSSCDLLKAQKEELAKTISDSKTLLEDYGRLHYDMTKAFIYMGNDIRNAKASIYSTERSKTVTLNHLFKTERRLMRAYTNKAILPAGSETITYHIAWQKALDRISKANPKFIFRPMPIRSLRLRSRVVPEKIDDFYLATLPTFIGFDSGSDLVAPPGALESPSPAPAEPLSQLTGDYTYSLGGACPLVDEEYRKTIADKIIRDKRGEPSFGAVMTYSYVVEMPREIKGRYHPKKLHQQLSKLGGTQGFLSGTSLQGWLDAGKFAEAIELPKDLPPSLAMTITKQLVGRVMAAMRAPVPRTPLSADAMGHRARDCEGYTCQLAGWNNLAPTVSKQAEATLNEQHGDWTSITLGKGKLFAVTDIALFERPAPRGDSQ